MSRTPLPPTLADLVAAVGARPPRCGDVALTCIDGPAGAGKTTLAAQLGSALRAPVVHMDDLYQGWEQDLGAGLSARVDAWMLTPWADGLPGMHPRYDWLAGRYTRWVEVPVAPRVILEGCGSASAPIRARAALVVWVEAPRAMRLERGVARDGHDLREHWLAWQAREDRHFADDGTARAADVHWSGFAAS